MMRLLVFVNVCVLSLIATVTRGDDSSGRLPELNILLMTSTERFDSSGAEGAVTLATDRVNADRSVLAGYSLKVVETRDTKCDGSTSVREFLSQIQLSSSTIIGVIGCGCTVATEPVADIVSLYGLPLVSYSPVLGSRKISYDNSKNGHFQLYPSDDAGSNAIVSVVKQFGWKQISILTQNEQPFIQKEQQLLSKFSVANIKVLSSSQFGTEQDPRLVRDIFVEDARVFVVNAFEDKAIQLLCAFINSRIENARYAWILYGWYSEEWWRSTTDVNCTEDELASVLDRALVIQLYPTADNTKIEVDKGMPPDLYKHIQNISSSSFVEALAYDSVWALALGLNMTVNMINNNDTLDCGQSPVPLEQFTYGNSSTSCFIRHSLSRTNFTGVSGQIRFEKNGIRWVRTARILQYRNVASKLQKVIFAHVELNEDANSTFVYLDGENDTTIWKEGYPPHDGTVVVVTSSRRLAVIIILCVLSIIGIITTTICLLFSIIFRKRKIVRLMSPNLNYFVILGCYLIFASSLQQLPTDKFEILNFFCKLWIFEVCIGYALVYGTILAKLWRMYFIFNDPFRRKKRNVSDWRMSLIILGIVAVVVVLLVIGTAIPITRPSSYIYDDLENQPQTINGTKHEYKAIFCLSSELAASVWVIFLYGYLGLLQLASFILAVMNRKVKIKALNDSQEIRIIVYLTSFATVEMIVSYFSVGLYRNAITILFTGNLVVATMVTILLIYMPKMVSLWKDPQGKKIYERKRSMTVNSDTQSTAANLSNLNHTTASCTDDCNQIPACSKFEQQAQNQKNHYV